MENKLIQEDVIERKIFMIRGQKVMLDKDLAELYGVRTRDLNKAVVRNLDRFPKDFMFQLSKEEFNNLMFHFGTSRWGGTRKMPYVFTEHGILMLSSVLRSKRAIYVNVQIMRTFVKLNKMIKSHKELLRKIEEMEKKYNSQFKIVFDAIRQLMTPSLPKQDRVIKGGRRDASKRDTSKVKVPLMDLYILTMSVCKVVLNMPNRARGLMATCAVFIFSYIFLKEKRLQMCHV